MKLWIFAVSFLSILFIASPVQALRARTVEGYPACVSEEMLEAFVQHYIAGNESETKKYLDQRKCMMLGEGTVVDVIQPSGALNATVGFLLHGGAFYTWRDGVVVIPEPKRASSPRRPSAHRKPSLPPASAVREASPQYPPPRSDSPPPRAPVVRPRPSPSYPSYFKTE